MLIYYHKLCFIVLNCSTSHSTIIIIIQIHNHQAYRPNFHIFHFVIQDYHQYYHIDHYK